MKKMLVNSSAMLFRCQIVLFKFTIGYLYCQRYRLSPSITILNVREPFQKNKHRSTYIQMF